ncbi:hypothetical protein, partial [Burkholderia glumae]|uniref:hypothetical protein n=1 Tax=Burkholderia glumae TaxID=337 RepID=UPI0019D6B698
ASPKAAAAISVPIALAAAPRRRPIAAAAREAASSAAAVRNGSRKSARRRRVVIDFHGSDGKTTKSWITRSDCLFWIRRF